MKRINTLEAEMGLVKLIVDNIYKENEQTNKVSSRVNTLRRG